MDREKWFGLKDDAQKSLYDYVWREVKVNPGKHDVERAVWKRRERDLNDDLTKEKGKRERAERKIQELELCLATKEAKISEDGDLKTEVQVGKARIAELEGELADLKTQPRGRYVESLKGEVTFEEEAKYWKKRWKQAEQACGEIAGRVEASWRGVYEKEVKEEVDRRMKKGKPRGKDKEVQVSTPQVAVSPAGTQTEEIERREKGKQKKRERGAKVEKEDEVMKDGSDDAESNWRPYEDLSSYEDEDEAPVVPLTKIQAAPRPAAKKPVGRKSRPTKTAPEDIPSGHIRAKGMVIHGVPCHRPVAKITEQLGEGLRGRKVGIMGARWLVGGSRRLGKATSSVVVFFEEVIRLGSQVRLGGHWLPVEAYDFDRGRK